MVESTSDSPQSDVSAAISPEAPSHGRVAQHTQKQQTNMRRQQKRELRVQKRAERVDKIQKRLQRLRTEKTKKKRRLIFRIIRASLLALLIIPLGALAIAVRSFDVLELPLELLMSEIKGTAEASEANDSAAQALESVHTEASEMGLQRHSVMLADPALAEPGSISTAEPEMTADMTDYEQTPT